MGIFKRDKIYYIRINGKRISTHTDNKKIALWIYRNVLKDMVYNKLNFSENRGVVVEKKKPEKKKIEIEKVFQEYISTCEIKKFAKGTIIFKKLTLKLLLNYNIKYFSDINQDIINKIFKEMTYSSDTQRKFVAEMRAFLNNSIKKGCFTQREYDKLDFPAFKTKPRDLIFTDEDMKKIYDHTKKNDIDFYFYIYTLYNTVSRPNEVTPLEVKAFDFTNRTVTIFQNKTKKTKIVYLGKKFCDDLKEYIDKNKITGTIFTGADSVNEEYYGWKFRKIRHDLDLNFKYTLYTYRHTSITNLLNATNDIEFAAKQAGNNPEIAIKHYVNRNDQHYKDIMESYSEQ